MGSGGAWTGGLLLAALAAFAIVRLLAAQAPVPDARGSRPAAETLGGLPRSQFFLERDRFLPATDPATVTAGEAGFLQGDDEVFGVVVDGEARAYPIPMIAYHHVVNDVIRGIPVAVTY